MPHASVESDRQGEARPLVDFDVAGPDVAPAAAEPAFPADARHVRKVGGRLVAVEADAPTAEAPGQVERRLRAIEPLAELASTLGDELRGPLAGIAAAAEVVRDSLDPSDERSDALAVILEEANRLLRFVDEHLDLGRQRQPFLLPTDVAADVDHVSAVVAPAAARSGVVVDVDHCDGRVAAHADSQFVRQAFLLLANNAVAAMPHGGRLTMRTRRPDVGSDFVCVEFVDTGRGFGHEARSRLFDSELAAGSAQRGVARAARLIENQGGHLTIETAPGQGACFTVYLRRTDAAHSGKGQDRGYQL